MAEWNILATGHSMSKELADSLRGSKAIVVSDCFRIAPWAYALVSCDRAWWRVNADALEFQGRKFSFNNIHGVERIHPEDFGNGHLGSGTNSGLMACCVAQWLGATKINLYGFDLHGTHFFGEHPKPLKNTTPIRYTAMISQFRSWKKGAIEVINMTKGSALDCFPMGV